jgi:enoyl-CoA hydratase/carnithine racemase
MIPMMHPRLLTSVWSDPQCAAEAENLAHRLAGDGAPAHILELARELAEAQIAHRRVNQIGDELARGLPGGQRFGDLFVAARSAPVKSAARSMILAMYRYERRYFSRWKKRDKAFQAAVRREQRSSDFAGALRYLELKRREEAKRGNNPNTA